MTTKSAKTSKMLDVKSSLLLIVDVQEKLMPVISEQKNVISNIVKLVTFGELVNLPVVYTEQHKLGATMPEIKERLSHSEPIVKKEFNCFLNDNFRKQINRLKISSLIVAGVETHICICQTALEAIGQYNVHFVSDAVFHHTYEGNMNDTKVFKIVIEKIKGRIKELGLNTKMHTVVFDRGNNFKANLVIVKKLQLHYVGALTPYHHKELVNDAMENFRELEVDGKNIWIYRDKRIIWQEERTVIVFISERLKSGQIRGIYQLLGKAEKQLQQLQESLSKPRAKKRDRKQLEDKITNIVKGQFIKDIIDWSLKGASEGRFCLEFTINQARLGEIEKKMGFRILMTDRHEWETVEIIKTYYGQSMIEQSFKNLKNPYHLALRPEFHWTDQKIKVHFFICVLGYLLATIVWREARTKAQFRGTLDRLIDALNNVRLAAILEDSKTRGRVKAAYKLEEMSDAEEVIMKALGVKDAHNDRTKFKGVSVYN